MAETVLSYQSGAIRAKTDSGERILVRNLAFTLCAGESMALIGETGSGKTMTALSLMGLLPDNVSMPEGEILFLGKELKGKKDFSALLGREIVYIPQNGLEFLNPSRTIRKQFFDTLERLEVPKKERESAARQKLSLAGFQNPEEILSAYPFQLSGGMAQRVTIALSACTDAKLILADEPTNGLDEKTRESFMELLSELFPTAAKLIITHDMSIAALCEKCLVLCGGRPMESGDSAKLLKDPLQPYTQALLGALVSNGLRETPTLRAERGDCPFYSRCPQATESCKSGMTYHKNDDREWWCNNAPARGTAPCELR